MLSCLLLIAFCDEKIEEEEELNVPHLADFLEPQTETYIAV